MRPFYFNLYENRKPLPPLKTHPWVEFAWQSCAVATVILGLWYLAWRWRSSLNYEALWFAYPMVIAETLAFIGMVLFFHNLWKVEGEKPLLPASTVAQKMKREKKRKAKVDIFITTYDEDPELVRYSIRDAKKIRCPKNVNLKIYVLDDGGRCLMQRLCVEEGVRYISRDENTGFKAGNLRNAMEQSDGDFIVICDADTRLFPSFLENTLGYFNDENVAWVQTPQWFYDIPEGRGLGDILLEKYNSNMGKIVEKIFGEIKIGHDPFINDPKMFYDVILRRRNRVNASFCCGAGSIHRREAIMESALKSYSRQIEKELDFLSKSIKNEELRSDFISVVHPQLVKDIELTPYKFHVSEDIYTSIILHSDGERNWKSILHPNVEAKMLSPLDLHSWMVQRFKYAGGTLDIMWNDNPLFEKGMSVGAKLMYGMTFWSYLSPLWNIVFITAPIIGLFTGLAPISAYGDDFLKHFLPFILLHELSLILGLWGLSNFKGRCLNLAFFWVNLKAMGTVLMGKDIKFVTTPKSRQEGNFIHFVWPQIIVVLLTLIGIIGGALSLCFFPSDEYFMVWFINSLWGMNNIISMMVLICAAFWKPEKIKHNMPLMAGS